MKFNFLDVLKNSLSLQSLIGVAVQVIFIALLFEVLAWWLMRHLDRLIAPLITIDAGREHHWRVRRRLLLRQTPKQIVRTTCYLGAMIAVLSIFERTAPMFSIPVLPVAIIVGALILVFGVGAMSMIQDAVQGYSLLAEDAIAIGDLLEIDSQRGTVRGTVERFSPRAVWMRDTEGRTHNIANREIRHVVMHRRREDAPADPHSAARR